MKNFIVIQERREFTEKNYVNLILKLCTGEDYKWLISKRDNNNKRESFAFLVLGQKSVAVTDPGVEQGGPNFLRPGLVLQIYIENI